MRLFSKRDGTQMNMEREKNKLVSQRRKEKNIRFFFFLGVSRGVDRRRRLDINYVSAMVVGIFRYFF
jgi:hypothetical protein